MCTNYVQQLHDTIVELCAIDIVFIVIFTGSWWYITCRNTCQVFIIFGINGVEFHCNVMLCSWENMIDFFVYIRTWYAREKSFHGNNSYINGCNNSHHVWHWQPLVLPMIAKLLLGQPFSFSVDSLYHYCIQILKWSHGAYFVYVTPNKQRYVRNAHHAQLR